MTRWSLTSCGSKSRPSAVFWGEVQATPGTSNSVPRCCQRPGLCLWPAVSSHPLLPSSPEMSLHRVVCLLTSGSYHTPSSRRDLCRPPWQPPGGTATSHQAVSRVTPPPPPQTPHSAITLPLTSWPPAHSPTPNQICTLPPLALWFPSPS